MPVAVVARRDIRRHVGLAQRHRLAVVGFTIVLESVFVALAAALIALLFEVSARGLLDVVRAVAIGADGRLVLGLLALEQG